MEDAVGQVMADHAGGDRGGRVPEESAQGAANEQMGSGQHLRRAPNRPGERRLDAGMDAEERLEPRVPQDPVDRTVRRGEDEARPLRLGQPEETHQCPQP